MMDNLISTYQAFMASNLVVQFLVGFVLLFFFFVFVVEMKYFCERLIKKGGVYWLIGWALMIVLGILFVIADFWFNVLYMPLIYGEMANKHGEGWLVTSRLQWHKAQPGLYWQKRVSLFICDKFVERADPEHCTTSRWS